MLSLGNTVNMEKLQELVDQLPESHRKVVNLMLRGDTDEEIAEAMDMTKHQVRILQKEAIWFCRGITSNYGLEEGDYRAM